MSQVQAVAQFHVRKYMPYTHEDAALFQSLDEPLALIHDSCVDARVFNAG